VPCQLHDLSGSEEEDLEVELAELSVMAEQADIVANGHLDHLIREQRISVEDATSLMNDSAYAYRIARNLIAMARVTFGSLEGLDMELQDQLSLDQDELRAILTQADPETQEKVDPT
jgi:phosphate:Na+ symporter